MLKRMFNRTTGTMLLLLISALILSSLTIYAQDNEPKESNKESKKKPKQPKESLRSVYKKWIDEDVAWIITDEERKTFKSLKTDDEREQFIEQFWLRRDPDPDTDENEYRDEYYQRIAYANEKFTSGIPGWKTDRGRIYIMFGKPDEIESHPSGGTYDRPTWEGGGTTSTYPFETWWYRYIEGVGSDVEIEFVDPTGSGEYHIARSPDEKDALLYVPNAGLTLSEQLGLSSKADRIAYGMFGGGNNNNQLFGTRAKDQPFEKLDLLAKLQRPPKVRFNDLAALANESDLPKPSFDVLPVNLMITQMRVTDTAVLTSFTVQVDNQDVVFKDVGGIQQGMLNIYGKITNAAGRRMGMFEDPVTTSSTQEGLAAVQKMASSYMKNVVLQPGIYKIDLAVRDVNSGKTEVKKVGFEVRKFEEGKLASSTMILASSIQPLSGRLATGAFVFGSLKVIPNATNPPSYTKNQSLGIYMQVYNVAIDQATLKPSVDIEYVISQKGKDVLRFKEDGKNGLSTITSQQITLAQLIPLKDFKPGTYDVQVIVKDNVANQTLTTTMDSFEVKDATPATASR